MSTQKQKRNLVETIAMEVETIAMDQDSNKKKLSACAMKGKWKEVIEMYDKDVTLHDAKITRSEDTALHMAVSEGKEEVVEQMVYLVASQDRRRALNTRNHRGNTALHLGASMGNAKICHIIASVEPSLVDRRNVDGETPLFLAALHGRKEAFLYLHHIRYPNNESSLDYVRRNNGDTILHCAIAGDYFDLAFQIIHLYKELANLENKEGLSPLHLLASKPSAFRSGCHLRRMESIIYRCLHVEELEVGDGQRFRNVGKDKTCQNYYPPYDQQSYPTAAKDSDRHDYPDNYNTCWDVFRLIKTVVTVVTGKHLVKFLKDKFVGKGDQAEANAEDPEVANRSTALGGSRVDGAQTHPLFPANCRTCRDLVKFFCLVLLVILGGGSDELKKIRRKKENHTWSVQIVEKLLHFASLDEDHGDYPHDDEGFNATTLEVVSAFEPLSIKDTEDQKHSKEGTMETPILVAAKNGVMEIIERILELSPAAIHDLNGDKKNIVLLAVEHRQPHVYQFLLKYNIFKESLFRQVDNERNNALHLAAKLGDYKPWLITGEALQMQWEIKWYEFVKASMPPDFFGRYNNNYETPDDVFTKTHKYLQKRSAEWLFRTSESCSLVAALIATVAYATDATVPGGADQTSGHPILEKQAAFKVFAISSVIALGCSVTAVVVFLSILTSHFQDYDFNQDLPRKLILGLTSLFVSIASMLVSFYAGNYLVLVDQLQYAALPLYIIICLPVTLFGLAQFPLYCNLLWATFKQVPKRSYRPSLL